MALNAFNAGAGFGFSQSEKASLGINQRQRVETATIIVAADGTGDFETIQEAINSIENSGGFVQLKEGTFTISSTITIPGNISLRGVGNRTIIKASNESLETLINITGGNVEISALQLEGVPE